MEQCIFDFGIINYNPAITWTVPAVFFFLALLAGGSDSNLLIVFYVQIMPDDLVMQLHRF
ncbi:hypothetical protein UH30_17640 [Escherichia coli]|nr:hypothetical protein UH30_17640 [Escherichia coli]